MAKVNIDKSQAIGNRLALIPQKAYELRDLLRAVDDASAIAQASPSGGALGAAALEGSTYEFGCGSGQGPDAASALTGLRQAFDTFLVGANGDRLATLYNGIVE